MSGSNSQFFFNALKVFTAKVPNAIIYAADLNEATDEIEALEVVLGTGLRTRSPISWTASATSFTNLTSRLNNMDAGIRSTDPAIHPQYATKNGAVLQPTDGVSVGLTVQGDPANAADLLHVNAGDNTSVVRANAAGIFLGKTTTINAAVTINSASAAGLLFVTTPGYTGDVIRIGNGTTTTFAIRADGTVSTGALVVTTSPVINDFTNMQHDHSTPQQGGRVFPAGVILPFAGITPPPGWLLCTGQAVNRIDYAVLYGVIGNAYGVGDGVSTFNMPDLRGRFPMGRAASGNASALGSTGGSLTHVLSSDEMPPHAHSMDHSHSGAATTSGANHTHQADGSATATSYFLKRIAFPGGWGINSGTGTYFLNVESVAHPEQETGSATADHSHDVSVSTFSGQTGAAGGGAPLDITPPYLALNYIIKA